MAKFKTLYVCQNCGYESSKWLGKCPDCNLWNCFVEENISKEKITSQSIAEKAIPVTLKNIEILNESRVKTNIDELDRVLGGGIVNGSLVLIGGEPGIGKSTLILQICQHIGEQNIKILYASGEESVQQIKLRAERLNVTTDNLYLLSETNLENIKETVFEQSPSLLIIDSIQTVFSNEISSAPGSVSQVRACTITLMRIAKDKNISTFIVGHVTKEGAIAGPRILEHMVDTVLYFEGERYLSYRVLRSVKNRFGSTNEIGMFEMREEGLVEVSNASEYMLSGRALDVAGSVVTCSIEGSRPILAEVQSLINYTKLAIPRRTTIGIDNNRVSMLIAVIEKKLKMYLSCYDSYVNLAGGIRVIEPSLDLAIISAISSSFKNKVISPKFVVFGEVGLAGEIKAVNMAEKRIVEAAKMGFKACILPQANLKSLKTVGNLELYGISNLDELMNIIFNDEVSN